MPYLLCKKIENDVYNFPTWQYCKYKDIFDSRIIINSTAKFYISISYQKDLLSIDTRIFTPSHGTEETATIFNNYLSLLTTLIQSCSLNKDKTLEILNMLTGIIHGYTTLQLGNAFSASDKVRFELAEAIDTLLVGIFQKYK